MQAKEMSRKQFAELPLREWSAQTVCASVVVVPTNKRHDSGYGCFGLVAVDEHGEAICRISGQSDALEFLCVEPRPGWRVGVKMDLLPKSRCFQFWKNDTTLMIGPALSDVQIQQTPTK